MLFNSFRYILTTIFFLSTIQLSFSNENIIPIKKPSLKDKENIIIVSDNLMPLKKPSNQKDDIKDEIVPKIEKNRIAKIDGIIIPKNKPLIVKEKRTSTKKKSIYCRWNRINENSFSTTNYFQTMSP